MQVNDKGLRAAAEQIEQRKYEQWTTDKALEIARATIEAYLAALPGWQPPKIRFSRAKGQMMAEIERNLPDELYRLGDVILVWVNEGDFVISPTQRIPEEG